MALDKALMDEARQKLYSAVISDVLDGHGNFDHAMGAHVRPVDESLVMVGTARTGLYMDVYDVAPGENPYDVEIALIDDLRPGDVPVFSCPQSGRVAPWGELLSTVAQVRGAAGAVMDGFARDIRMIRQMGFPVFCGGINPLDSKGRAKMMRMDVPVMCGGVKVCPGDLLFGDVDGVVVVPQAMAETILREAITKVSAENTVRDELRRGDSLKDVFARHGIL
ncbi:MAG: RraA family protein [Alphaproteobacteria bacterium]